MTTSFKTTLTTAMVALTMAAAFTALPSAADARAHFNGNRGGGYHRGFVNRGYAYRGHGYRRYPGYYGYGGGTSCGPLGVRLGMCAYAY